MSKQQGFTLIELMIVVAIIAILAAVAIPQYQDYITKSEFAESQSVADGLKTPVVDYYNQTGTCPDNTAGAADGLSTPKSYSGKYVSSAATAMAGSNCIIRVYFKPAGSVAKELGGRHVDFTGTNNGGTFSWECDKNGASGIAAKFKPRVCQ